MSLGGTLAVVLVLAAAPRFPSFLNGDQVPRYAKCALIVGLILVGYLLVDLLLHPPFDKFTLTTLSKVPLFLGPLLAFYPFESSPRFELSEKQLEFLFGVLGLAYTVSLGRVLWQYLAQGMVATGFFGNPIYYGYNVLPAFLFFAEAWRRNLRLGRFDSRCFLFLALECAIGATLSETRMVWACLGLYGMCAITPALWKRLGALRSLAILLGLGLGTSLILISQPRAREKMERSFRSNDPSRVWRLVAWKHSWELFKEHPLLGVGPEKNAIDTALQPEFAGHWSPGHRIYAHSVYLQALGDSGLIGLLLILGWVVSMSLAGPISTTLWSVMALSALTENIFNNSRAAHALFYFGLLSALMDQRSRASTKLP